MKKIYKLHELDCANCAGKMEDKIKKIDGVISADINFLAQRLMIECEEKNLEYILKTAQKIIKKIEPQCKIIIEV